MQNCKLNGNRNPIEAILNFTICNRETLRIGDELAWLSIACQHVVNKLCNRHYVSYCFDMFVLHRKKVNQVITEQKIVC